MKTGFFEEAPGVKSSSRLSSIVLLMLFCVLNFMWVKGGNDLSSNFLFLDLLLLIGIFTPRYLHKLAELKLGKAE